MHEVEIWILGLEIFELIACVVRQVHEIVDQVGAALLDPAAQSSSTRFFADWAAASSFLFIYIR